MNRTITVPNQSRLPSIPTPHRPIYSPTKINPHQTACIIKSKPTESRTSNHNSNQFKSIAEQTTGLSKRDQRHGEPPHLAGGAGHHPEPRVPRHQQQTTWARMSTGASHIGPNGWLLRQRRCRHLPRAEAEAEAEAQQPHASPCRDGQSKPLVMKLAPA